MARPILILRSTIYNKINKLSTYAGLQFGHITTNDSATLLCNIRPIKSINWKKNPFFVPGIFSSTYCTEHTPSRLRKYTTFPPGGFLSADIDRIATKIKDESCNVLVMAGAGLSTPSGIPDFRSPESGIYDNLQKYKLPYPEAIFDIDYFRAQPQPFNTWCKEYLPGVNYKPSIGHYFVRLLQDKGKLLRHYTQNIDGLDVLAGVEEENIVAAHGSFSNASCINCKKPADLEEVKKTILSDGTPYCEACGGLVKPDIVFFGEMLPERFWTLRDRDVGLTDILICIGTSLEVYPFAGVADSVPKNIPRLLINRDLVGSFGTRTNDHHISGDLAVTIQLLVDKLGWSEELKRYLETF